MARGLHKLTGIANTMQAREDWEKLACKAVDLGFEVYEIAKHSPRPQDGWKKVDKCIASLRAAIAHREEAGRHTMTE